MYSDFNGSARKGNTTNISDTLKGAAFGFGTQTRKNMRNLTSVKECFYSLGRICIEAVSQSGRANLNLHHCSTGLTVIAPMVSSPQVASIMPKSSSGSILSNCDWV